MIDEITRALNSKSDKVDLKAEKIELGLVEDLKSLESEAKKLVSESNKDFNKALGMAKEIGGMIDAQTEVNKKAVGLEKIASSKWKEYQSKAKELGIDPRSTDAFKNHEGVLSQLLQVNNGIEQAVRIYIK